MASELTPIDIRTIPELARLAEEARTTGKPQRLRVATEDVDLVVSATPKRRAPGRRISAADRAAFLASAGSWKDVDTDTLVQHIYDERSRGDRPAVKL
jgi:hypothetical protein